MENSATNNELEVMHVRQIDALRGKAYLGGLHGLTQGSLAGDRPLAVVGEDVLDGG
jgi:hypothetical protein